mmetsp:Transcript_66740/g.169164  ORF Transcript_66740/g.169164 Transcript_66740/m.169164 type:complete len:201 (+) Transcript_66740:306-908(+)
MPYLQMLQGGRIASDSGAIQRSCALQLVRMPYPGHQRMAPGRRAMQLLRSRSRGPWRSILSSFGSLTTGGAPMSTCRQAMTAPTLGTSRVGFKLGCGRRALRTVVSDSRNLIQGTRGTTRHMRCLPPNRHILGPQCSWAAFHSCALFSLSCALFSLSCNVQPSPLATCGTRFNAQKPAAATFSTATKASMRASFRPNLWF